MSSPLVPADRKIRFAVVGCGRIAASHFRAIREHGDRAELVGICDVDPAALARARAETGAPAFASLGELLASTSADVVALCTPSGLHAEQAIEVAARGLHVVTEKPMAVRLEDAERMIAACDAAGVRLFVVLQNRKNTTLRLLERAIAKGRFGSIYMVAINVFWQRPQSYYDSAAWRGTRELDGGALMNQACHYVDLLHWLFGPVESVQAYTATLGRAVEVEDSAVVSLRWRSGTLGSLSVTLLTYPKNLEGSLTVMGEKGTVRVGGLAVNEIQHWQFAEPDPDDALVQEASYQTTSVYGFGHLSYYDDVIRALRAEPARAPDGRDGVKSLEVLAAIAASVREGRRVPVTRANLAS